MRHYWVIHCPEAPRPAWISTEAKFDDQADAVREYHGAGWTAVTALAAWGHHAFKAQPDQFNRPGFQPDDTLHCPHEGLRIGEPK